MSSKRVIFITLNILCPIFLGFLFLFLGGGEVSNITIFLVSFVSVVFSILSISLLRKRKFLFSKLLLVSNLLLVILLLGYLILKKYELLSVFSSVASFKAFILNSGHKGIIIYILIQLLQVVFLPVPASIIALAGALIYGPFWGSVFCTIGVLSGSFTSYLLGKVFGFRLVSWVVGKDNATKYSAIINNKGMLFLPIAFLLPMFPDDILCWIAGITTMKFSYYSLVVLLTRPIGVVCMCYFGGGYIIPFSGWGLCVWGFLAVLILAVVILTYKYQTKMEEWILSKFNKKKKRR